jgi:hypothetical protein
MSRTVILKPYTTDSVTRFIIYVYSNNYNYCLLKGLCFFRSVHNKSYKSQIAQDQLGPQVSQSNSHSFPIRPQFLYFTRCTQIRKENYVFRRQGNDSLSNNEQNTISTSEFFTGI